MQLVNDRPWWVAKDVCFILGIANVTDALKRLDPDERALVSIEGIPGGESINVINEPGLYQLVLGSRKPEAKAFKRWVTHEVLPQIRQHGGYGNTSRQQAQLMDRILSIVESQQQSINLLAQRMDDLVVKKPALSVRRENRRQELSNTHWLSKEDYTELVIACYDHCGEQWVSCSDLLPIAMGVDAIALYMSGKSEAGQLPTLGRLLQSMQINIVDGIKVQWRVNTSTKCNNYRFTRTF